MKTPEQQSDFFPEFSDKMIIKKGTIVVINNDEAVAFSDLVKCWNARADLLAKAREWCESELNTIVDGLQIGAAV